MTFITLRISGMRCASCASKIEEKLRNSAGVKKVSVDLISQSARVEYDPALTDRGRVEKIIEGLGYKVIGAADDTAGAREERATRERETKEARNSFLISVLFGIPLFIVAMAPHFSLKLPEIISRNFSLIQFLLATPIVIAGFQFYKSGIISVIKTGRANMDTLIAVGTGSAYVYSLFVSAAGWAGAARHHHGLYFETAGLLIVFILMGRWLEAVSKGRTSDAVRGLISLQPKTAIVIRNGAESEIPIDKVLTGDIVVVKPGQRLPADGVVIEGESAVDESMITGESVPVDKRAGSRVICATVNKAGAFKFRVEKTGEDTVLSQIIKLVRETQMSKASVQKLADTIAAYFVPAIIVIAASSFCFWFFTGKGFAFALTTFISVLIISCPCSLGLAVPTAIVVGTGAAAKRGVLFKSAESLQKAAGIDIVVFDKTGTLTKGKPELTDVIPVGNYSGEDVLRLAAIAEKRSEHPIGVAVVRGAGAKGMIVPDPEKFISITGKGVRAARDGKEIFVGTTAFLAENNIDCAKAESYLEKLEASGKTAMVVAYDKAVIGVTAVADTLKTGAKEAVDLLKKMGKDIAMITGDNFRTARAVASELEIANVTAEVLPQGKVNEIGKVQAKGLKAAMVGDGINDAPALIKSDTGIALGAGTDVAIESADIVLMKDDLRDVAAAFTISRLTMRKIRQNLFWAFIYNLTAVPIAAGVIYPFTGFLLDPVIAAAAMSLSSVSVVLNSLLLKRDITLSQPLPSRERSR